MLDPPTGRTFHRFECKCTIKLSVSSCCGRSVTRLSDGPRYYWRPPRRPTSTQAGFFDDRIVRLLGKFPIRGRLAPQTFRPIMHVEQSTVELGVVTSRPSWRPLS